MLKKILFNLHLYGIFIFTYGWVLHPYIVYIQYIVILSWLLNNNKCLITELEYYFLEETCMGGTKNFVVPKINRYTLYINCLLASIYNINYLKIYQY